MTYRYQIVDGLGRLWGRTLTMSKARRIVARLDIEKGIRASIVSIITEGK